MNPDNETRFEEHIKAAIFVSPLYFRRPTGDFDIKRRLDPDLLWQFLHAQTDTWNLLVKRFKTGDALDAVIKDYNSKLDNGHSLVEILRKGLKNAGNFVFATTLREFANGETTKRTVHRRFPMPSYARQYISS